MKKLILHVPHSSSNLPFKDGYVVSDELLKNEILKLTDWYTDDLFCSDKDETIKAEFSRIFCDTERFSEDAHEEMASVGMGVLYEKMDDGKIMRVVSPELRIKILNDYYWTHHQKLNEAVNQQLEKFGKAIIIDCHSMSDIPFIRDKDQDTKRTDYSIGTDSFHTSDELLQTTMNFFKDRGIKVAINYPYSGTIVPMEHYKKNKSVQSIMIEVNRKIYLNDHSNDKSENYSNVKTVIQEYLEEIRWLL